jgi:hypothetical protein
VNEAVAPRVFAWQPPWRPGEQLVELFLPMGLLLELVTNSPAILDAARQCFGGYGVAPAARPADLQLRLYAHAVDDFAGGDAAGVAVAGVGAGNGRGPLAHARLEAAPGDDVAGQPAPVVEPLPPVLRCEGPYLYQASGRGSVLVADRAAGFAFGYLSPAVVADPPRLRSLYLEAALFFLLEGRGFVGVHGAAVALDGRALLLRGASGQGKTTLAYAAARRGFQAIAEEVVWIETEGGRWWGAPWVFHLLADACRLFPELEGVPLVRQPSGEHKLGIELEQVRAGSTAASARAGPLVMLERCAAGRSELVELDAAAARGAWLAGGAAREREVPGYEAAVATLLRGGCYRLRLGDDLDAAVDLLAAVLA